MKYRLHAMESTRAYTSPLRKEQMQQTRLRILEAVTRLFGDAAAEEVTIPAVARAARVSLRTVYRYFATREALIDAWAEWVDENLRIQLHSYPEDADRLPEFTRDLYRSYDESEALVKAMLGATAAREVRARTRRRRQRGFRAAMDSRLEGLAPEERRRALAAVYLLVSAPGWQAMKDQWGLDGEEAGEAAAWAVGVLLDELSRNPNSIKDRGRAG